jgi:hypothetical protein
LQQLQAILGVLGFGACVFANCGKLASVLGLAAIVKLRAIRFGSAVVAGAVWLQQALACAEGAGSAAFRSRVLSVATEASTTITVRFFVSMLFYCCGGLFSPPLYLLILTPAAGKSLQAGLSLFACRLDARV